MLDAGWGQLAGTPKRGVRMLQKARLLPSLLLITGEELIFYRTKLVIVGFSSFFFYCSAL